MDDFAIASAVERRGDGRFVAQVPDGWQQGRGAFGGLVLGTLARALGAVDEERPLRTISGDICGPVLPGEAEIVTRVLRRGSSQTNVTAELRQNGAVQAIASAVLSAPRPSPSLPPTDTGPAPCDWRTLHRVELAPPLGPPFALHYDYRLSGAAFAAAGAARAEGFIRERTPLARLDAAALVGRLDAWWPTLINVEGRLRPMATVSFTAELLVDPATLPPAEPSQYRARMAALHDGFFVELRELWGDGRVIALNQQTFAIIK
jgi:hypothetical protein